MTPASLDVLLVDDEPNIRRMMTVHLTGRGHRVRAAASAGEAAAVAGERSFDVAFVDIRLGTESGLDLLPRLLTAAPGLKVIVITAYASVETAVEAMRRGAADYLAKPFTPAQIDLTLEKVTALFRLERRVQALEGDLAQVDPEADLDSASPPMQTALRLAHQAAPGDARVLLRGESGTGKEVAARALHRGSPRAGKPFVAINCATLSETLLESELFGHERGAFTGAVERRTGKIEAAQGGTLFLDEIGELPPKLQAKLLRVLQEREFERIGSTRPIKADIRLIAATNRDLEKAMREGTFREDLYYRLNVITVALPSLRERREDIPLLASHFAILFGKKLGRRVAGFTPEARACLLRYDWPGNVRELANAIERAVVLGEGELIHPDDLPETVLESAPATDQTEPLGKYHDTVNDFKKRLILSAIDQAGGSIARAAELLDLNPTYLHRLIRNFELKPQSRP